MTLRSSLASRSLGAADSDASKPAGEWALDLLVRTGLNVGAHLDRPELAEEYMTWLAHDYRHCTGSDGIYQGQRPHPRGYGAFSRTAGYYLAEG